MLSLLLVLVVLCVVVWWWVRWASVKRYWSDRGVPYAAPNAIFGNLTFIMRVNTNVWFRSLNEQIRSPYLGIWLFWRPALVINSPELARNILTKDADLFRDRHVNTGQSDTIGKVTLLALKDPDWTRVRKKVSSLFTSSKMKDLNALANVKVTNLMERMKNRIATGKPVDLRMSFADYTTDLITYSMFGLICNATVTGDSPVRSVTKLLMKYNFFRGLSWACIFFYPDWNDIFRFKLFPKPAIDYLETIFDAVMEHRKSDGIDKNMKYLVDIFLHKKHRPHSVEPEMTKDEMLASIAILLLGGFDTTSNAITFAAVELAHHPEVQEKLYQELMEAKQKHGTDEFDASTLADLTYFNCVIKESLRKYPAMAWLDRIAAADYRVDEKLTISARTPVYVNVMGMHYNPEYFPEPDKFDPDRFLPENEKNIVPYAYLPFGNGPRICIGQTLGLVTMRALLSRLVLWFRLQPEPSCPSPGHIPFETRAHFLMPAVPLSVQMVPRPI